MRERAVRIGKPVPLVGVISEPDQLDPGLPAVLIFNSGVMHHIGTCRLSVKLARAFAAVGNLAIRFDFSGIGDSEPRRGTAAFDESAPKEASEVMDYLEQKRGIKTFVVYGLCSGADAAYQTALRDSRVVGFAQIDPFCYRTPRYYVNYYLPRILVLERWISTIKRLFAVVSGRGGKPSAAEASGVDEEYFELPTYTRVFPPRDEIAAGLDKILNRKVANCVVFTGSEPDYNYESQYRDSFKEVPFGNLLKLNYMVDANHIITDPRHQGFVTQYLSEWLRDLNNKISGLEVDPSRR